MRTQMIHSTPFEAAVFIGGMDGLFEEWAIFLREHPGALVLPVASTEGAARLLWMNWTPSAPLPVPDARERLARDVQYRQLFNDLLR